MFAHIFIYRFKVLINNKQTVFWTLLFPLLLGTFFYMAFMNIGQSEIFRPIPTALVQNAAYRQDPTLQAVMKQVSHGKNPLLKLKLASSKKQADQWLRAGSIQGYFTAGNSRIGGSGAAIRAASTGGSKQISSAGSPQTNSLQTVAMLRLTVKDSELDQSILKIFADQYRENITAISEIARTNPEALQKGLLQSLNKQPEIVRQVTGGAAKPNNVLNYFYTLIAMACMYGSLWGMKEVTDIQADLSTCAARVNLAPVHKLKAFLAGSCAALIIQWGEILVLLAYLRFGLKIDFGPRTGYVLLTALSGSVLGFSFGTLISAIVKKGEGLKIAVMIASTMLGSFLAGMMFEGMKYFIAQYVPVLSWLNPVNVLTDAFYALYYYDSLTRFEQNLGTIVLFILLFGSATYLIIRRRKYASL